MIINILKSFKKSIHSFIDTYRFYKFISIIKKNNEYLYIYMGGPQVGDVVYEFSCIESFLEKTTKKICIIGDKRFEDMYKNNYSEFYNKLWLIDKKNNFRFIEWTRDNIKRYYFKQMQKENLLINPYLCSYIDVDLLNEYFKHSWIDTAAKFCFNLDNYKITYPKVKQLNSFDKYNIDKHKKRLILIPYANSMKINIKIFKDLVSNYKNKYNILTNCFGEEKELEGTTRLECSKDDLYNICKDENSIIVGVRCGIMDFIANSSNNIICIYNKTYFSGHTNLKYWNDKIINIYYNERDNFDILCQSIDNIYGN